jgi:multidrug efflux pump subunit AcrA (membrane-fusion protein)
VNVAAVESADIPQLVTGPATLFPREQANVSAKITAPIRELRVRKGDEVHAGQVLAVLENRDLSAQQQEAQSAVTDAEASLQRTVAGTVPTDIERARGQVETTRAAFDQAQKNYDRRKRLFEQGAVPQKDLLQTETELATAKANREVAEKSLDLLERQSGTGDVAIAKARVEQAKAHLAGASANLKYAELISPFEGTVTEQFQYPGDMAGPATPTYTIMDLSSITARAQIPESGAASVQRGQACAFSTADPGVADANGHVIVVSRAVDPARRTVEVWCEIPGPPAALRAGTFGNVSIQVASIKAALIVPAAAIQVNEGTNTGTAFVVDAKHIAHKRDVQIGVRHQDRIQVQSGLQSGEMVVTEGGYGMPDGVEVRTEPSGGARQ